MTHYADKNAGKRLREARWLNQMSQQELADKIGLGLYGEDEMPSINREHAQIISALDCLAEDDKAAIKKMIRTLARNR